MSAWVNNLSIDMAVVASVNDAVLKRTGILLGPARQDDLKRSIAKVMEIAGVRDPSQWMGLLTADHGLFDQVVADITVGETYFFREPEHFAFVRGTLVPDVHRRLSPAHDIRVWSAGCSTGEEAYSLAILFDEARVGAQVLATDISRPSLAKAKAGVYGRWSLRGEGARLIGSYLRPVHADRTERYELVERVRQKVNFAYFNLAWHGDTPLVRAGSLDLIFCRNVLIYLDAYTITRVAQRFYDALSDGGVLILGPSDPLLESAPFIAETTPGGVMYRKDVHGARSRPAAVSPAAISPAAISPAASSIEPDFLETDSAACDETPAPPTLSSPSVAPTGPSLDALRAEMETAFTRGDNARVVALAKPLAGNERAAILGVRAGANLGDMTQAAAMAAAAAKTHPASAEIAYLQAILLMNLGRLSEAEAILKRLVYLDPKLAVAQFTLGNLRLRGGDLAGARRAFRTAHKTAAERPPAEVLALSDGATAGQLAAAAAALSKDAPASAQRASR